MNQEQTEAPSCRRLADKVMTTEAWLAKHRDHGDLSTEDAGHPSGTWKHLVCQCGAKHLTC